MPTTSRPALACLTALLLAAAGGAVAHEPPRGADGERAAGAPPKPVLDRSGKKRVGKASFYARKFFGRTMADGTPMDPNDDNAASKTLPLGTTARVTNLETGQSAVVTIQDRGPYVKGRIVDLSPATAEKIGLTPEEGLAPVEVAPIAVPQPDGSIKAGAAARELETDS
ncbi:MAG TPA: septal ring lytic transglycosylase RlpA family protein [Albitalea sp.]